MGWFFYPDAVWEETVGSWWSHMRRRSCFHYLERPGFCLWFLCGTTNWFTLFQRGETICIPKASTKCEIATSLGLDVVIIGRNVGITGSRLHWKATPFQETEAIPLNWWTYNRSYSELDYNLSSHVWSFQNQSLPVEYPDFDEATTIFSTSGFCRHCISHSFMSRKLFRFPPQPP